MPAKRRLYTSDEASDILATRRQRAKVDLEDVNTPDAPLFEADDQQVEQTDPGPVHVQTSTVASNLDTRGLSPELVRRVMAMRCYSDEKRGLFYINDFPTTWQFGQDKMFDMTNYIVHSNNRAALTWILGRISSCAFTSNDGQARDSAYVVVKPLSTEEVKSEARLIKAYSYPSIEAQANLFGTILASRMQTRFGSERPPDIFRAVYDATSGMKPKEELTKVDARRLKRSDLVLLETKIRKRFPGGVSSEVPKSDMDYTINFQLQAVFLIKVGDEDDNMDDDAGIKYGF